MPPPGAPRPDAVSYDRVATFLETELDRAEAARPHLGKLPLTHRLSRTEYRNAVRDLLALESLPREVSVDYLLPPDNISSGFDNIADLLFVSPSNMERYLDAARKISRLAVGDPAMPVMVNIHRLDPEHPQDERVDELPFGTRGGIAVRSEFPVDGTYIVRVEVGAAQGHDLEILVDGERVALRSLGGGGRGTPAVDAPPGQPDPADPDPAPPSVDRPAAPGRGADPAGAAGSAGASRWRRRWSGSRRSGRSTRISAHAEGRPQADRRRVRAAHRGARRGDASSSDAQPRHAAGDQQRHDQRTVQGHRRRRFAEPAPHLRLPTCLRGRRNSRARGGFCPRSRAARIAARQMKLTSGTSCRFTNEVAKRAASISAFRKRSSGCSSARSSSSASSVSLRT